MSLFWIVVLVVVAVTLLPVLAVLATSTRRDDRVVFPPEACARARARQPRRRNVHRTPTSRRRAQRSRRVRVLRARIGGVR